MTKERAPSQNAIVHGLYAKDVLLPWDSKEDFIDLHSELRAEFSPHGRLEEEEVLNLAFQHWHRRTIWRMWQASILKNPFAVDIKDTKRKSWSGIRKRLRASARKEGTMLGAIESTNSSMISELRRYQKELAATSDKDEIKCLQEKMGVCIEMLNQHVAPLLVKLIQGPSAEKFFDKVYEPESLEKIMRLDAEIDTRISKCLGRLVVLKEFKRTPAGGAGMKAIEASRPS
jgi:hypothetical protein